MKKGLFLAIVICISLSMTLPAQADIAPPETPPGSAITPGGEVTQVQMVSEKVIIEVQEQENPSTKENNLVDTWAMVTADFTMKNTGQKEEYLEVRFPLSNPSGSGDGWGGYPEIMAFWVYVDGVEVRPGFEYFDNPLGSDKQKLQWATFNAGFPKNREVKIQVKYSLEAWGYIPMAEFDYVLETGAGWKGKISSAEITLVLPYEASDENIYLSKDGYDTSPGGRLEGNSIHWIFKSLEPTPENNIKVTIVDPRVWKEVLATREKIRNNPTQEDHLKLARAINQALSGIKGFMREDPAGKPMFDEAIESLDKAGESVEAYTLRAEMLFKCEIVGICPKSDHAKAVEYLKKAFAIDPEYQPAIELAWGFSTEDIIPTVQPAQPEENPTEEAETPGLGEVQSQAGTQVPGSGQEDQPGAKNPLCGSLGLIPLALIVPTIKYAKRQSRH